MILDALVLENVGVYAGRQEADLSPVPGKPVILFGGLNGGGKTTILEGLQLAFYGPKARLASRGTTPYREFLREAIHRGVDPGDGAAVAVRFRRIVEGETRQYEVRRSWRVGAKGLEESLHVWCNGEPDPLLTDNWGDYIEGYLPSSIAHLFFFDGEQIKDLAEGQHAAEILGTAIQTLLGLDIVDRLETDLKVLERRKRNEALSSEAAQEMSRFQAELERADREQAAAMSDLGRLTNEAGALAKEMHAAEESFRREGGEAYEKRAAIEAERKRLQGERSVIETRLRELAAGAAPFLLLEVELGELGELVQREGEIRQSLLVLDTLVARDRALLDAFNLQEFPSAVRRRVVAFLEADRRKHEKRAAEKPVLNADPQLGPEIVHLRGSVLPQVRRDIEALAAQLRKVDEALAHVDAQLARIPSAEIVTRLQERVEAARSAHLAKMAERSAVELAIQAGQRFKDQLERRISQFGLEDVDERFAHEDRQRLLKHSGKVRATLGQFRTTVMRKHAARLESLILESFQQLLRKSRLVTGLRIDPEAFTVTLTGHDGQPLPFNRLSAGERQLLATSLLWGLARASGRPIPTVIDTPLGRLDSSHRHHLVERYFPVASHQVILLSTDEEIAEEYHDGISPHVARRFLLLHDERLSRTSIVPDQYFDAHETAR